MVAGLSRAATAAKDGSSLLKATAGHYQKRQSLSKPRMQASRSTVLEADPCAIYTL